MTLYNLSTLFWLLTSANAATTTFVIPSTTPTSAVEIDSAPVSLSVEFFDLPSYFTNVSTTFQCLQNFKDLTNVSTAIRIGGTTQDRAVYDPDLDAYVSYTIPSGATAPTNLTFGPSFMTLAGTYDGVKVIGLNRGHDNFTNTIEAAKLALSEIPSLKSIELGNEPDLFLSDGQKIATDTGVWTPETDAEFAASWQISAGEELDRKGLIQAGNFVSNPPEWGAAELISSENSTALEYISNFAHHHYPQSGGASSTSVNLTKLMSHEQIVENVALYDADVAASNAKGFHYVMGETNSVTGGGAAVISSTFGAGLWVLDYTLRAVAANIKSLYFHHGTIGSCYYCWFGNNTVFTPYYGAYTAATFLAGGASISALDDGSGSYGGYVVYSVAAAPLKVILYNSDYYDGDGDRSSQSFVLTGLTVSSVSAKRLSASSAISTQSGGDVSFGGQTFDNVTCGILGSEVFETTSVANGQAVFEVSSSEALLIIL